MPGRFRERYKQRIDEFISKAKSLDALLIPLVHTHFGEEAHIDGTAMEKIHKGVFRIHIRVCEPNQDVKTIMKWRIVCKVSRNPNDDGHTYELMRQLWSHGFASDASDGIHIAQPLRFFSDRGWLFMEEVSGRKVRNLLNKRSDPAYMRFVARALAKLHQCSIVPPKSVTIQNQLRPFLYKRLAGAYPGLAAAMDAIPEQSVTIAAGFGDVTHAPVHGDFHLGQVHIKGEKLWLLDVDGLKYGDPAIDVGNFLTLLSRKDNPFPNMQELIEAFEDEYYSIMGPEMIRRVQLYKGLALMRRACKLFRFQVKDSKSSIENMVNQAVQCVDSIEKM